MTKKYTKIILSNGLTVILYPIKEVKSAFATCYIKSGNLFSKDDGIGVAHFLEHLSFCSTEKYKSRLSLSRALNNIGAHANAQTTPYCVNYWIKSPSTTFDKAIEILYQLVFKINLSENEIEKERNIIYSEFKDNISNENSYFSQQCIKNRFKNLPQYQTMPIGDSNAISQINKSKLEKLRNKYFNPSNMILSITGNFNENKLLTLIKSLFGREKRGVNFIFPMFDESSYSDFSLYYEERKSDRVWFDINWPTFGWIDTEVKEELALAMMNYILGIGPLSKLNMKLREQLNITYFVNSYSYMYPYLGYLGITCSVDNKNLIKTLTEIEKIIVLLKTKDVLIKQLQTIKKYIKFGDLMRFETMESIADYYAKQILDNDRIWEPEKYAKKREEVTEEDIKNMANKVFDNSKVNINIRGDISKKELSLVKTIITK